MLKICRKKTRVKKLGQNLRVEKSLGYLESSGVAVERLFRGTLFAEVRLGIRDLRVKSALRQTRQYALFAAIRITPNYALFSL